MNGYFGVVEKYRQARSLVGEKLAKRSPRPLEVSGQMRRGSG